MDVLLIELLLWGCLLLFLIVMRDSLNRIEADIEKLGVISRRHALEPAAKTPFSRPSSVGPEIGRFQNQPIFGEAVFDGERYQFDRVQTGDITLAANERCVPPGLVYRLSTDSSRIHDASDNGSQSF